MSCYFQVEDNEVWNPSNSVARLFLRQAVGISELVDHPSGLGEIIEDECEIDPRTFSGFVDAIVSTYQSTNNEVIKSLIEGFTSVASVLVERINGTAPSLQPELSEMWSHKQATLARSMPKG
ncbi:DUF6086 family protein [Streptomyces sp. WM6378]|uniref:DUF6086 family protein n=1 Tax=Streptomyces sp. WM6378 TaxID=1415557 RepID=UPI000A706913|nr:DUF6086 family protein [Streptomyces sp. WM6378]